MSTLVLSPADPAGGADYRWPSRALRTGLCGDWAILFSRPDDFVPHDWEVDRWLVIIRRTFLDSGVRPLVLASSSPEVDRSRVGAVNSDAGPVTLEDWAGRDSSVHSRVRALREHCGSLGRHFVMIVDDGLFVRRTFTYRVPSDLPSPLDLMGWRRALICRRGDPASQMFSNREQRRAEYQPNRPSSVSKGVVAQQSPPHAGRHRDDANAPQSARAQGALRVLPAPLCNSKLHNSHQGTDAMVDARFVGAQGDHHLSFAYNRRMRASCDAVFLTF